MMVPIFLVTAVIGLFYKEVPLSQKSALEQVEEQERPEAERELQQA